MYELPFRSVVNPCGAGSSETPLPGLKCLLGGAPPLIPISGVSNIDEPTSNFITDEISGSFKHMYSLQEQVCACASAAKPTMASSSITKRMLSGIWPIHRRCKCRSIKQVVASKVKLLFRHHFSHKNGCTKGKGAVVKLNFIRIDLTLALPEKYWLDMLTSAGYTPMAKAPKQLERCR